jgi:hypothetical protein
MLFHQTCPMNLSPNQPHVLSPNLPHVYLTKPAPCFITKPAISAIPIIVFVAIIYCVFLSLNLGGFGTRPYGKTRICFVGAGSKPAPCYFIKPAP